MTLRQIAPASKGTHLVWTGDGFEEQTIAGDGPASWVDAATGGAPTSWEDIQHAKILSGAVDPSNPSDPEVAKFLQQQQQRVAQQRAGSDWDSKAVNAAIPLAAGALAGGGIYGALAGEGGAITAGGVGNNTLGGGAAGDTLTADGATGAFDMGASEGVFDSAGNSLYSSPTDLFGLAKQYGPQALSLLKDTKGIWGPAIGAGLGAVGASQQSSAFSDLAKKYMDLGDPSRQRYEASFAPGFTMANDPGYKDALDQTTKATLHGLSVQGNPAGSPNAWNQTLSDVNAKFAYPALQNYRSTNANAGGIASLQTAAPGAATGAINANAGVYNALGAGAADIFNPPKTLAQILKEARVG